MYDPLLALYDHRNEPKDPGFRVPMKGEESAYYEAGDGAECPVCGEFSPEHRRGCWIAGEFEMSYQKPSWYWD